MDGSCEPLWCADASSVACAQLLDLPDDALLAVLAYLQPTDLMMCRPVCRRLRDLCLQPALWRASRLKVRGEALMLAALRLAPCLAELDVSKGMEHAAAALASSPCKVARLRLGDDGSGEGYYAREVLQRVAALGGLQTLVIDFCSSALDEKHPLFKLVRDSVDASPCNGWEPPQSLLELVYYLDIRDLHLMCSAPLIDYPIAVRPGMETKPCLTTLHYLGFGSNQVDYFLDLLLKTHASTLTDVAVPPRYCSLSTLQSLTNLQSVSMDNWSYPTVADYYDVEGDDPGEDDAGEYGPGDDPVDDDAEDDPVEGDVGNDPVDDDVEDDPVDDDAANDPVVHDVGNDPVDDDAGDDAMDDAWDDPVNNEAEDAFAPGAEDFLGLVPDDDAGDLFPPGALEFLGLAPDLQYVSIRGFMDQESILTLTQSPCVGVLQELWLAIDPYFPWDLLSSSLHWFSSLQTLFVNVMPPEDFLRAVTPASAPCLRMLQLGDDELRIHDVLHEPAVKDLLERNSELHLHLGSAGRRVPSGCDCRWCLHKAQRGWKRCSTFASHSWAAECCGSHCFQWP